VVFHFGLPNLLAQRDRQLPLMLHMIVSSSMFRYSKGARGLSV